MCSRSTELLEIPVGPFLQYVEVLLNSRPVFEHINASSPHLLKYSIPTCR